jgi:acetolactate synthase-1/2/3 large subunit
MSTTQAAALTVAEWVAEFLVARGVDRVFGLQGGHIQPIWDHLALKGVRIVDVRDEGAAVHMAHAHAVLSGGIGVASVTAGPGVTNCVTAMANAQLERVPVLLIGGCAPMPQDDLGPLQGIDHVSILRPVTRSARTLRIAGNLLRDLDKAVSTALGDGNAPGPVYVEIPTDVLRQTVPSGVVLPEYLAPRTPRRIPPDAADVERAAALIAGAKRPLVLTGRGALGAGAELVAFLDASGAVYLDTQESRGLVPPEHPATIGAMRGRAMQETDLAIVVGRKLDYQTGYGSPAVWSKARFLRIGDNAEELRENRRGEVELFAHPALALAAIARALPGRSANLDAAWGAGLRSEHLRRAQKYAASLADAPPGKDGRMHPNRIFAALREVLRPNAITVADGGDILSFARTGLETSTYLDAGAFGCLGVGTPYGVAAALLHPERQVVVVTGDGAFGINAMEIDSAQRHGAKVVFIVSNNAA